MWVSLAAALTVFQSSYVSICKSNSVIHGWSKRCPHFADMKFAANVTFWAQHNELE